MVAPLSRPPAWMASLRSPQLLGTFASVGFAAGVVEFLLALGIPPLLRGANGPAFALVVLILVVLGLATWAGRLGFRFLAVGICTGFLGLLAGMYLSRLMFFAFT